MRRRWVFWWVLGVMLLSGCRAASSAAIPEEVTAVPGMPSPTEADVPTVAPPASDELLPEEPPPVGAQREFTTDFSQHTVPYSEILSGGPPKDGIPAIDEPQFTTVEAANAWLEDQEPVILMEIGDVARAYPIQILTWHEIVNDTLDGVPVTVTFCPLCNTAIAFDRRLDDLVLDFGTTGRLRYSNLIMYDRQTETWWQQATGEAIAGEFAGRQLTFLPANMISWSDFKATYPDSPVLSRITGFSRQYGRNPYLGYDNIDNSPFLYDGPPTPGQLAPMARILAVELNDETVAYPYATLEADPVVNDTVGDVPIVVLWQPGVASALDQSSIAEGRDVGTVVAFSREDDGDPMIFMMEGGRIVDSATGTVWNVLGQGVEGPRAGEQLTPIVGVNHFWFSWAAFKPETRVYHPEEGASSGETTSRADNGESVSVSPAAAADALEMDFEIVVYTGAGAIGGDQVQFSEVLSLGKPVLLEFWAGLCPTCRRALPETQEAYRRYGDQVTFVGLDIGRYAGLGNEDDARALYADLSLSFPVGSITDPDVLRTYRVTGIPTTLYFTADGELFDRGGGIVGVETHIEKLDALILASGD